MRNFVLCVLVSFLLLVSALFYQKHHSSLQEQEMEKGVQRSEENTRDNVFFQRLYDLLFEGVQDKAQTESAQKSAERVGALERLARSAREAAASIADASVDVGDTAIVPKDIKVRIVNLNGIANYFFGDMCLLQEGVVLQVRAREARDLLVEKQGGYAGGCRRNSDGELVSLCVCPKGALFFLPEETFLNLTTEFFSGEQGQMIRDLNRVTRLLATAESGLSF